MVPTAYGEDEFLFPTYDEKNDYSYVADYLGELYLDSKSLNQYYLSVLDITKAYEELGVACYFVIIPNSQTVYPENMPDFMGHTSERTRLVSVTNYLARRKKFPPRTCGSVFKNPSPEQPAGKLLEEVGAKSLRVGGASVWSEHANVIVAGDGCTSSDILALARLMAARVRDRFGISLIPEIRGLEV